MFNERDFILKILIDMIGKELDYRVRQSALNWYEKGVLTVEDLSEIDALIDAKNTPAETGTQQPEEAEETEE